MDNLKAAACALNFVHFSAKHLLCIRLSGPLAQQRRTYAQVGCDSAEGFTLCPSFGNLHHVN